MTNHKSNGHFPARPKVHSPLDNFNKEVVLLSNDAGTVNNPLSVDQTLTRNNLSVLMSEYVRDTQHDEGYDQATLDAAVLLDFLKYITYSEELAEFENFEA